jgi:hypothetical protein
VLPNNACHQILKEGTLHFSRHGIVPNLSTVIPVMDKIDDHFTEIIDGKDGVPSTYHPAIRAAVALGKKTLNKYYALTDLSVNYRIAMSE